MHKAKAREMLKESIRPLHSAYTKDAMNVVLYASSLNDLDDMLEIIHLNRLLKERDDPEGKAVNFILVHEDPGDVKTLPTSFLKDSLAVSKLKRTQY